MNYCHTSSQEALHAQRQGEAEQRDEAWKSHREELVSTLLAGQTVYIDRKRLLDITDVESEMADDENLRDAIICCNQDETGAGALLACAKRDAVSRLLEQFEGLLRQEFEQRDDNDFFAYREAV